MQEKNVVLVSTYVTTYHVRFTDDLQRPVGQAVGRSPILCAEQTSFPWMYYRHANLTKHIISWTRSLDTSWNAAACEWGCNSIVTTTTTATNNNNSPACEASQELAF